MIIREFCVKSPRYYRLLGILGISEMKEHSTTQKTTTTPRPTLRGILLSLCSIEVFIHLGEDNF